MKPLLLQSVAPAESSWVRSEDCKGIQLTGTTKEDWFKINLDCGPDSCQVTLDGSEPLYLFNGIRPRRVKIIYVEGNGPVDVDLV